MKNKKRSRHILVLDAIVVVTATCAVTILDPFSSGNNFDGIKLFFWWLSLIATTYLIGEFFARKGATLLPRAFPPAGTLFVLSLCTALAITCAATTAVLSMQFITGIQLFFWSTAARIFGLAWIIALARIGFPMLWNYVRPSRDQSNDTEVDVPEIFSHIPAALGQELVQFRSEDHYIHFETTKGHYLKKYKFSDAIAEIGELEGIVVRRGTWVSTKHVIGTTSVDGQLLVELSNGSSAVVSRTRRADVKSMLFNLGLQ